MYVSFLCLKARYEHVSVYLLRDNKDLGIPEQHDSGPHALFVIARASVASAHWHLGVILVKMAQDPVVARPPYSQQAQDQAGSVVRWCARDRGQPPKREPLASCWQVVAAHALLLAQGGCSRCRSDDVRPFVRRGQQRQGVARCHSVDQAVGMGSRRLLSLRLTVPRILGARPARASAGPALLHVSI
jgi:hypothetical protein